MLRNKVHLWFIILVCHVFLLPLDVAAQTVTTVTSNADTTGNFRDAGSWNTGFYPASPTATSADIYRANIRDNIITFQRDNHYTGQTPPLPVPVLSTVGSTNVLDVRLNQASGILIIAGTAIIERLEVSGDITTRLTVANTGSLTVDRLVLMNGNTSLAGDLFVRYRPGTSYSAAITPLFRIQSGAIVNADIMGADIDFVDGIELDIDSTATILGEYNIRFVGTIPTVNNGNVANWGRGLIDFTTGTANINNLEFNYTPASGASPSVTFSNQNIDISGDLTLGGESLVNISGNSTITVEGNLTLEDDAVLNINDNATLIIGGNLTVATGAQFVGATTSRLRFRFKNTPTTISGNITGGMLNLTCSHTGSLVRPVTYRFTAGRTYRFASMEVSTLQNSQTCPNTTTITGTGAWNLNITGDTRPVFNLGTGMGRLMNVSIANSNASSSNASLFPLAGYVPPTGLINGGGNTGWFHTDHTVPSITAAVADDPDNMDGAFGNGDTLTFTFDVDTNQAPGTTLTKAEVDTLFNFGMVSLGTAYTGEWTNSRTLELSITNAAGATPPAIGDTFTLRTVTEPATATDLAPGVRNRLGSVASSSTSPALTGDFGLPPAPMITGAVADDPDDGDIIFGNGDTLIFTFDVETNQAAMTTLTKAEVDALFNFGTVNLGTNYTGEWTDRRTLVIMIVDATGSTAPTLGSTTGSTFTLLIGGNIRRLVAGITASTATSPPLTGDFGRLPAPMFTGAVADDPNDLDDIYSNGDTLTFTFDVDTNQAAMTTLNKAQVDALFDFGTVNLGRDYTGLWMDRRTLVITIVDITGATAPTARGTLPPGAGSTFTLLTTGNIRRNGGGLNISTATSPNLTGDFGRLPAPMFTGAVANDPTDRDGVFGNGDTLTFTFDVDTNQAMGTTLTKTEVDTLFNFGTVNLGTNYTGRWTDMRTLVITIVNATGSTAPTARGTLPPGAGSRFTLLAAGNIRRNVRGYNVSTATSPNLTGDFGQPPAPMFTGAVADDPDDGDTVFGNDDTLTFTFDVDTNQATGTNLNKAGVDALFNFGTVDLGRNYTGRWRDMRTLVITIVDATGSTAPTARGTLPPGAGSRFTLLAAGNIRRNIAGFNVSTATSPNLTGDFGRLPAPVIRGAVADDPDDGDTVFGNEDTLTFTFDVDTNQTPGTTLNKAGVDTLFNFGTVNLGTNYTGRWTDRRTLVITIVDATGAGSNAPTLGAATGSTFTLLAAGNIRRNVGGLNISTATSPRLTGDFGRLPAPMFTGAVADDPNDLDDIYSNGDTLTFTFDVDTNQAAMTTLNKAGVDALFDFGTVNLGRDYTGLWRDRRTLVITIVDITGATAPTARGTLPPGAGSRFTLLAAGNIRRNVGGLNISTATSPRLTGDFGRLPAPMFTGAVANDPTDRDGVFGNGDTLTFTFNVDTNQAMGTNLTKTEVDALFNFGTVNLGTNYTGRWTDMRTLVITIVDATGAGSNAPTARGTLPPGAGSRFTLLAAGNIRRNVGGFNVSTATSPNLTGDFGQPPAPMFTGAVANDPDDMDDIYGNDDTLTFTFDLDTNQIPTTTLNKAAVDALFDFGTVNLGTNYTGRWTDRRTLVITIVDATGAGSNAPTARGTMPPGAGSTFTLLTAGNIRREVAGFNVSTATSPNLTGDFGQPPAPMFTGAVANDPDDMDDIYGNDDTLTFTFDLDTNQIPTTTLNKAGVDALFDFGTVNLGTNYTGRWTDRRTLVITIVDATGATAPTARGTLPPGAGSTFTLLTTGNIRREVGGFNVSTATSPPLTGDFGQPPAPMFTGAVANDPDDMDDIYGNDDTLTFTFDVDTNQATGTTLTKAGVDALFNFGTVNLGTNYTGRWTDMRTLVITIADATGAGSNAPTIGATGSTFTLLTAGNIRRRVAGFNVSTATSPNLTGDFGDAPVPMITAAVADDSDDMDDIYGNGDTLTFTFDVNTNQTPGTTLNKAGVDNLFDFGGVSMGADYTGEWTDRQTLIIMVIDAVGATPPAIGNVFTLKTSGDIRREVGGLKISNAATPPLSGDFGEPLPAPVIISAVADDPDNADKIYSNGDTLTFTFDVNTNQAPETTLDKAGMDNLFDFGSVSLGADYSGEWTDRKTLIITVIDAVGATPPAIDNTFTLKASGDIRREGNGFHVSDSASPPLRGDFGHATSLSEAVPAPSLFRASRDSVLKFLNIPPSTVIRVYSVNGRRLFHRRVGGDFDWDVKSSSGKSLGSGVYIVHLIASDGEKKILKFLVIR